MRLLLDTHSIIWFINNNPRLPQHVRDMLEEYSNVVYISMASLWEMSIKVNLGKLDLDRSLPDMVRQLRKNGFHFLPVRFRHIYRLKTLPHHHKDPFDRMLIAQSLAETMPHVSCDDVFDLYEIQKFW